MICLSHSSKECVICREAVSADSALLLACGHRYHEKCIKRYWKILDGNKRCVFNCVTRANECVECGGKLKGNKCEFCGAEYISI